MYIMDKEWCEANNTVTVQDFKDKKDNFAVRNANGTGPYALVSREQDVKTVLRRNEAYWGKAEFPLAVSEIVYLTIKSRRHPRRRAHFGRGRLRAGRARAGHRAAGEDAGPSGSTSGPENRTIFLGMDVGLAALNPPTSRARTRSPTSACARP